MVRFLHTADLHASYRQYGYKLRELDTYDTLDEIGKLAQKYQVNAVIIAGDTFDAPRPSARAVKRVQDFVRAMQASGITVFGNDGNHDPSDNEWLNVCGVQTGAASVGFTPAQDGVVVRGINYRRPPELLETLQGMVDKNEFCDILVLHQPLVDFNMFMSGLSIDMLMPYLKALKVVYVALGDIHEARSVEKDGIWFVYPGSPEFNDCAETTQGKHVTLIEIGKDANGVVTLQHGPVEIPQLRAICVHDMDAFMQQQGATWTPEQFLAGLTPKCHEGLNILKYSSDSFALSKEIATKLVQDGVMFHLLNKNIDQRTSTKLEREVYERRTAREHLKASVEAFFKPHMAEYELVMKILESPDNDIKILEDFVAAYTDQKAQ